MLASGKTRLTPTSSKRRPAAILKSCSPSRRSGYRPTDRATMQDTSQALAQLSLLHRTITLHTVFGASDETRERLLQVANELTGQKSKTLHSALGEIEVQIAKLRAGQRK